MVKSSSLRAISFEAALVPSWLRKKIGNLLAIRWEVQQQRRLTSESCSSEIRTETASERTKMVRSGGDELTISRVINGMWQISGGWGDIDRNKAVNAMIQHVDAGFTSFEMANYYGPAEEVYGQFINKVRRERGDEFTSKIQGLTKLLPAHEKMTRAYVESCVDRARQRMDVKTIDMLQLNSIWWSYEDNSYLDALKHLTDLKEEGKIKTIALANYGTETLAKILDNGIPIVSNQVQHSLIDNRPQKLMAELCERNGVQLLTFGTVMGGLLSESFLGVKITIPYCHPPLINPSLNFYKRVVDDWGGWDLFQELLRAVKHVADKHGVSMSTVAIRYILDKRAVAGSCIGVTLGLSEHIKDTQAVFKIQLDDKDRESMEAVTLKGRDMFDVHGDCGNEYIGSVISR